MFCCLVKHLLFSWVQGSTNLPRPPFGSQMHPQITSWLLSACTEGLGACIGLTSHLAPFPRASSSVCLALKQTDTVNSMLQRKCTLTSMQTTLTNFCQDYSRSAATAQLCQCVLQPQYLCLPVCQLCIPVCQLLLQSTNLHL